jgi:hypothetical protein
VFAWKRNWAEELGIDCTYTNIYILQKKKIRERLTKLVFSDVIARGDLTEYRCVSKIKRALTAISFGAKCTPELKYLKKDNKFVHALCEIFRNSSELATFANDSFVMNLVSEQREIVSEIFKHNKSKFADDDSVKNNGRFSSSKVVSSMYQTFEQELMRHAFKNYEDNIILNLHDGFYTRGLSNQDILCIRERFDEYNFKIEVKTINGYSPCDGTLTDSEQFVSNHNDFIKYEEIEAFGNDSNYSTCIETKPLNPITDVIAHIERGGDEMNKTNLLSSLKTQHRKSTIDKLINEKY